MSEQVRPSPEASRKSSAGLRVWPDAAVAACILSTAGASLYVFYFRGLSNLYGDGISHMEGARRIFDSLTPGYQEIGSVWLPLYHLLVAPLAINDHLWRTGLAGSLVSTAAFCLAAWILFRLAVEMIGTTAAGWVALAGMLFCPSMMYLASTPLTEPLMVCMTVLTVYGLFRFQMSGSMRALTGASLAAMLGTLTRYDGWFLLPFAATFVFFARPLRVEMRFRNAVLFCCLAGIGPALWLLHNAIRFGNPLEFLNGPFSAQAVYAHQVATTGFRYPTDGSLLLSARYFLADLVLIMGSWPLILAALGFALWVFVPHERPKRSVVLLFLVPFIFYVYSMAHSAVALYVPTLFPHTYYNLRYGIEMLPGIAIFPAFLLGPRIQEEVRRVWMGAVVALILGTSAFAFYHGPSELPVVVESVKNTPCKSPTEQALTKFFKEKYDGGEILTTVGEWPCLMPETGIPFHKTISEANHDLWLQAGHDPAQMVEWIIRGQGDSVDELMQARPNAFKPFDLVERFQFGKMSWVEVYRRRSG
ncbi:MAG: hypothetical protein ACM3NO_06760 [Deltaproteobacteria bacterium]